jgi:hypothetical protein
MDGKTDRQTLLSLTSKCQIYPPGLNKKYCTVTPNRYVAQEKNITKRNPILRPFHFIKLMEQMKKKMMNEKKRRL